MTDDRQNKVLAAIDSANGADPNRIEIDGEAHPAERLYGQRMSAMLEAFCPDAGMHLEIAARAQHIERWQTPRSDYPTGRAGYLKWRGDLKAFHARRAGELMAEAGFAPADIERVEALIKKRAIKKDPKAQTLEDVACLVFLKHYAAEFIAKHEDDKVIDILRKTARKMSDEGLVAAGRLALPDRLARLMKAALAD